MKKKENFYKTLFFMRNVYLFLLVVFFFSGCPNPQNPGLGETAIQVPAPSVTRGDGELSVGWAAKAGVEYEVWYGTVNDTGSADQWGGTITGTGTVAGVVINGLTNGTVYYVWIKIPEEGETSRGTAGTPEAPPAIPVDFVYVPGGTVTGSNAYTMSVTVPLGSGYMYEGRTLSKKGVFVEGRATSLNSFFMAKYETTRKLWSEVAVWAKSNGYTFQNENTGGSDDKPVTNISWRDAVVWCNAYSKKSGLDPVYYSPPNVELKDSRDSNGAACDNARMDTSRNGFRLPTETEREYAARGGDPGKPDWMFTFAGSNTADNVAWHHGNSPYTIQNVGGKSANRLGVYDLSGNVQEWGWDWMFYSIAVTPATPWDGAPHSGSFNQKPMAGGGVGSNVTMSCVADRWSYVTDYTDNYVGLRIVRKAP